MSKNFNQLANMLFGIHANDIADDKVANLYAISRHHCFITGTTIVTSLHHDTRCTSAILVNI